MRSLFRTYFACISVIFAIAAATPAQQAKRADFDIKHYVIDAKTSPDENKLSATAEVSVTLLEDTRSITFELNGSLKVDSIERLNLTEGQTAGTPKPTAGRRPQPQTPSSKQLTFVQDQVGVSDLGPSVRVDLGENLTAGTSVTIRFKYAGILNSPSGGPLLTKRLAYIGDQNGYLMYAARWFPFHNYAADFATADITISLPAGLLAIGYSDSPAVSAAGRYRFTQSRPGLIGNLAYGRYTQRRVEIGDYELQFFTRLGSEQSVQTFGQTLGQALNYYKTSFGNADFGNRLIIAEIDDESLDYYSAMGMLFIAGRNVANPPVSSAERLQREAAYQWWGLTVGLKSFDDAWLSQGLAEYSAFSLRESLLDGPRLESLRRELLEKALTFEQTASLLRAPATLDDQSAAYQYIMFGKGPFVFKLLRDTLGEQKFSVLLRTFLNEYRGKNASIDDFEKLSSRIAGKDLRYFFARWVEGTGVPEFTADYVILRTRSGKFVARGTVKQNYDNLRLPVDVQLRSEGSQGLKTVTLDMEESSVDFNIESDGKPIEVVIDPGYKLLRISPDLRVSSIARRGIELMKEGNYAEAQAQFEAALKLDRSNSWVYYHLGLLFLEQRNYDLAIDNFKAALAGNLNPPWLQVWCEIRMGNAYDAKGDRARAVAAYERAERLGDKYDNAEEAIKRFKATPYDPKQSQSVLK
ncbi:MAG: hypothetical protein C4324_11970 [Blastocatellia bacterium]